MRYIAIEDVKPGMILGKRIFDRKNRLIMLEDWELTKEFIGKLKEYGFAGVYIDDELSKGIEIQEVITDRVRNDAFHSIEEKNIYEAINAAQSITDQVMDSDISSLDLIDIRAYDDFIYKHSINVTILSVIIGMGLKLRKDVVVELASAAILHDWGKLFLDEKIINKLARLNKEEYDIVKTHARLSYEHIKDLDSISAQVKNGVLHHHENEDGSGYPSGQERENINLFSKIIHVADVYDALTTKKPYKRAYGPGEAVEYLKEGRDILFDSNVVDVFCEYIPVYPKGMLVDLSDGRKGIVAENYKENYLRPKVLLENHSYLELMDEEKNGYINVDGLTDYTEVTAEQVYTKQDALFNRKHILIVDDMVSHLKTAKSVLEGYFKLALVTSGKQAIDYMEHNKTNLILMDIDMPEMNGIETIRAMQKEFGELPPVIFFTALANKDTVVKCREVGAKDYIVKPYRPIYMIERIEEILSKS